MNMYDILEAWFGGKWAAVLGIDINNQEGYPAKDLDICLFVHVRLIEHWQWIV